LIVDNALRSSGLEPLEARLLLAHATGWSEARIIGFPEQSLPGDAERRFNDFATRRKDGEPIAYIVGYKEFYGLRLAVTPAVLIPRPETELLVDLALERDFSSLADLGTGSGAIALAIKQRRSTAGVLGVDASAAALDVARQNAAALKLDVQWRQGRWFEPLTDLRFDVIVANPPYVAAGDRHLPQLRYEPRTALVSGIDGLDAIREILATARSRLNDGGWLLIEHGIGQDRAVRQLLAGAGLEHVQSWPDLSGTPRVSGGRR
jgi:release factor glutamine methyltransferase